jgi:hypothetical protein
MTTTNMTMTPVMMNPTITAGMMIFKGSWLSSFGGDGPITAK